MSRMLPSPPQCDTALINFELPAGRCLLRRRLREERQGHQLLAQPRHEGRQELPALQVRRLQQGRLHAGGQRVRHRHDHRRQAQGLLQVQTGGLKTTLKYSSDNLLFV